MVLHDRSGNGLSYLPSANPSTSLRERRIESAPTGVQSNYTLPATGLRSRFRFVGNEDKLVLTGVDDGRKESPESTNKVRWTEELKQLLAEDRVLLKGLTHEAWQQVL